MTEAKPGLLTTVKSYPAAFWIANTMEIFERMAWYGFFAVSSLYITGPVETGGLGFTSEERGQLQAIVPFFLYLLPVVTGALADRYGYKKLFIIAYSCMIVFYYALGQFKTFPTFLGAFMLVAVAAAIFKPVVVGTVARVTDESNSSMGFGIFYMMVNVGGFAGPLIAGAIRGISWNYVFISCSCWAAINLVIVTLFYKDPTTESASENPRTLGKVAADAVEVLGNMRFGITVFTMLIALMIANQELENFKFWPHCTIFVALWLVLNFVWDALMPVGSGNPDHPASANRGFLFKRMHCSNWRFALFLLIMSGFWTSFNQIFLSMPPYVRDFVDTRSMVDIGRTAFGAIGKEEWLDGLAAIEETELLGEFGQLARRSRGLDGMVAEEPPTEDELRQTLAGLVADLKKLAKDDAVSPSDRQEAAAFAESHSGPKGDAAGLKEEVKQGEALNKRIDRQKRNAKLPTDPSLSDEDRASLAALVQVLNDKGAKPPLEAIDLMHAARTILQYKVRITPVELGELVVGVPDGPPEMTEDAMNVAVATINKRLDAKGKPEFVHGAKDALKLRAVLRELMADGPYPTESAIADASKKLTTAERELKPDVLALGVRDLAYRPTTWARIDAGRQVNPEHIVNMDALAIVFFQVLISYLMAKFHRFTTMIVGMVIAAIGIGLPFVAGGTMVGPAGGLLIVVIAGIVTFAIGEMMASPTSQEYVGRIAPKDKVAVYMGYYFVAVALGNLFGGILSGQLYGKLARDAQRPDLMWLAFGGIMMFTAVIFLLYNKFALPRHKSDTLTPG